MPKPEQSSGQTTAEAPRIEWSYDPARGCYDGEGPNGSTVCVCREGRGKLPWAAWITDDHCGPDSWHATRRAAMQACEEALAK